MTEDSAEQARMMMLLALSNEYTTLTTVILLLSVLKQCSAAHSTSTDKPQNPAPNSSRDRYSDTSESVYLSAILGTTVSTLLALPPCGVTAPEACHTSKAKICFT